MDAYLVRCDMCVGSTGAMSVFAPGVTEAADLFFVSHPQHLPAHDLDTYRVSIYEACPQALRRVGRRG